MGCTTFDLREKEVVNVCNGQKLGRVADLEVDTDCGRVTAVIVVPDCFGASVFLRGHVRIPWDKIVKIGCDTVLVEYVQLKQEKCETGICTDKKWWRR